MDGMILRRRAMASLVARSQRNYIQFEDKAVEAICVANWSSDGIGLTMEDAAKVTSLGAVFKGNTSIRFFDELQYFTGVNTLNTRAFDSCSSLKRIYLPPNLSTIPDYEVFDGCTSLESVRINSNITYIGSESFRNCSSLTDINIPASVKGLGNRVFQSCSSWEGEIDLPNITTMGYQVFNNSAVKRVKLSGVQTIGHDAFDACPKLEYVEFGEGLTKFAGSLCRGCTSLHTFICRAATPPTAGNNIIAGSNNAIIYVPDASLEAYKTAVNWSAYADRIHPLSEIEGGAYGLVSDGNAYIVTDYYPNTYDNVEIEFESPSSTTLQLLLGSRESLSYKNLFVAAINPLSGGGGYGDRFYSNSTPAYTVTNGRNNIKLQLSSDNEGRLTKDLFMHNDKLVNTFGRSFEPTEYVMPYPLVVFGSNQMNSSAIDTRIFKGTIYFVKITDARSGEVKLYLQPRVVDGVAGMMDTISGTFYTNSNTKGTFIVE